MLPRRPALARHERGQSLVEFALVLPILMLVVAGIIQFGVLFWAQNTLTQIARDTGRWAATQTNCTDASLVIDEANAVAGQASLVGYAANSWNGSNVLVSWTEDKGTCPPADNQDLSWVTITIHYRAPIFFPIVFGNGNLSTSVQYRMEPAAQE
jgi:Flp pilus assembly protein TadG